MRKILQKSINITEVLNVCYISINTLDRKRKKEYNVNTRKGKYMRIISGVARGTKLYTLEGNNTRPTLDRVKESLFNIIHKKVSNCVFLDLFSGSGAIGLEAVSRGAKKAILCDKEKNAIKIIEKNIEKTNFQDKVELFNIPFEKLLKQKVNDKLDIVYIDPPYKTDFAYDATKLIVDKELIKEDGIIIIETDEVERILKQLSNLNINIIDQRKYGRVYLVFLRIRPR